MAHHNAVIMPITVRFGSSTSVRYGVDQLFTQSGYRHANQRYTTPLRTLTLNYKMSVQDSFAIGNIFRALSGPFDTFLARDWSHWHTASDNDMRPGGSAGVTALDEPLMNKNLNPVTNQADGSTTVFYPYLSHTNGEAQVVEQILHPVAATVKIGLDGTDVTGSLLSSVNALTGAITLNSPPAGSPNGTLTWGGEFYRAVAFATDDIEEILNNREVSSYQNVRLQEIRGV